MYRLRKFIMTWTHLGVSIGVFLAAVSLPVSIGTGLYGEKATFVFSVIGVALGYFVTKRYIRWAGAGGKERYEKLARAAGLDPAYTVVADYIDGDQSFSIDIRNRKVFIGQNGKGFVVPFSDITNYAISNFNFRKIDGNSIERYYLSIKTNSFETPEHKVVLGGSHAACVEPYEKLRTALASAV